MTPTITGPYSLLKDFAAKLTDVYALPMHFNQEDQLKGPVSALVERLGVRLPVADRHGTAGAGCGRSNPGCFYVFPYVK
jgi:hypothetical protein